MISENRLDAFPIQVQLFSHPSMGMISSWSTGSSLLRAWGRRQSPMREHQSVSTLSNVEQTLVPELDIFESCHKIWKQMWFEERRIYFAYCSRGFPQWCLTHLPSGIHLINRCDRMSVKKRCLDLGGWKDVGLRPQYTFWGHCPD